MHAHELYAPETHAYEIHAHEMHTHKVYARETHTHERHAHEISELGRCGEIIDLSPMCPYVSAVSVTLLSLFSR
jgi:hypothetical protein